MTGGALGLGAPYAAAAAAPDGFACDGQIFQSAGSNTEVRLYTGAQGPGTISFSPLGKKGRGYNAMGVDPTSRSIFAIRRGDNHLLRINKTGALKDLGTITGLPGNHNYYIGGFDKAGEFYVAGYKTPLYKVDVKARKVVGQKKLSSPLRKGVGDIAIASGHFWAGAQDGTVQRIDPVNGKVSNFRRILPTVRQGYGGAFTYGNNDLGFFDNGGTLHRLVVKNPGSATPAFTRVSSQKAAAARAVDATACFVARADLEVDKIAPAWVTEGRSITYQIAVKNNGPADSSGWTVTDPLPTGMKNPKSTTPGCTVANSQLSCTGGPLARNETAYITVTGTAPVPGGVWLDNVVGVRGNDPDPKPDNNTSKTTTEVVAVPMVDPAFGAATVAGAGAIGAVLLRRRRTTHQAGK
ncbi:DUF11 domain-containing protein [Streptomyces sp. S.PB5]|uniref:DUF11 domain-containing protein n=1 Tax=Streptomyces sp. S.PB5 TaxID=3020844 RepID=UPI0025B020E1|nr:DUF11 domain-containing protein [Streptomyces sp. S.PB5]MDN3026005.1 DUF11 domain-containing protein [Streptomyces sp. S.PB5]